MASHSGTVQPTDQQRVRRRGPLGWFADRRVGTKVGLAIGACLLLLGAQGVTDVLRMEKLADTTHTLYEVDVQSLTLVDDARNDVARMRQQVLLTLLSPVSEHAGLRDVITELDADFDRSLARLRELGAAPQDQLDSWRQRADAYRAFRDGAVLPAARRPMTGPEAQRLLAECRALFEPLNEQGAVVARATEKHAAEQDAIARADAHTRVRNTVLLVVGGLLIGLLLGALTVRVIVRSLRRVQAAAHALAEGDLTLTADVDSTDEPGLTAQALDRALGNLRSTVRTLAVNAQGLAGASEELSTNSTQIAGAAQDTATEIDVASEAVQAISDTVRSLAAGAEEMTASIGEISTNASEAARVAAQAVEAAEAANTQVNKLGVSSAEIGDVIKVITSIAEQTNLLALNATIEAARAGTAGKGFAVVADEVKQLAQQTARATDDVRVRIEAIQADVGGAVSAIGEIAAVIGRISDYQTTIASAVEEQTATTNEMSQNVAVAARSSEKVSSNISGVARAASATTAGVQDARQAAGELAQMSAQLQRLVDQFTV